MIGVITLTILDGQNLNFAIPINEVKGYLSENIDLTLEDVALNEGYNIIYEIEPNNDWYNADFLPLGFIAVGELTPYDIDVFEVYVPTDGYLYVGGSASSPLTDLGILFYNSYNEIELPVDYEEDEEIKSGVYSVYPGYYYIVVLDMNIGDYGRYYLLFADML